MAFGPFHTPRLRLDPIGRSDVAAIVEFHADPRVSGLLLDTVPDTPELARIFVVWSQWLARDGLGVAAARRPNDDTLLGLFTLTPFADGNVELGGKLAPKAWGTDLATEAGAALIDHAFGPLGRARLVSAHHPDNRAVPAILARLGFVETDATTVFDRPARLHVLGRETWCAQGGKPLSRRLIGSTSRASRNAERGRRDEVAQQSPSRPLVRLDPDRDRRSRAG